MARYTKIKSKYILAKKHRDVSQGTLYERDWTTIGNVHRLEPGKRPYYGDSNFLFTENTFPVYKKKWKNGKWVGSYTYEDVKDATDVINTIKVNTDSDNLTDYAYWGSMTELFRGSVEHIVRTFPGMLRSTKKEFYIHYHNQPWNNGEETWSLPLDSDDGYLILSNPFGYDLHTEADKVDDDMLIKYLALSWQKFVLEDYDNGNETGITYYEIHEDPKQYDCEGRYFKLCYIVVFCGKYSVVIDTYLADGKIVYCYRTNEETHEFLITYYSGIETSSQNGGVSPAQEETNFEEEPEPTPARVVVNSEYYYIPENFSIHPNNEIIEEYFRNLKGFEKKLLNRLSKPLYQNTFLLPVQLKNGNWRMVRRKYVWPSEGYCIDVETADYEGFITGMVSLCEVYDNLWCDAIWRCMVHESVKNFDWSYRREYDDNDTLDNIEGGNRMRDTMRLYGLFYDKAKRYVDGIRLRKSVTYDGYNNCPDAQISDNNILLGWDITSTQHQFYWYESGGRIPSLNVLVPMSALPINVDDASPDYVSVGCPGEISSTYYSKRTLQVSDIRLDDAFYEHGIVEKQRNPWIDNNVYGQLYTEIGIGSVDTRYVTVNEYPYQLYYGTNFPKHVQVVSNTGTKYYKLLRGSEIATNNQRYVNGKWFATVSAGNVTPDSVDILFNRELNISSNRILKTKGTIESIEMVFALFGFGRYDENTNPYGDYNIEERYGVFDAKEYDGKFCFYEPVDENDVSGEAETVTTPLEYLNPTEDSPQFIKYETVISETSSYYTYYRLNTEHTVYDAIRLLYAHRLTEREYDNYYSGVPVKDVYRSTEHLIIPFNDTSLRYDGNYYFQSKGGWMKDTEESDGSWNYSETIPYLHILQHISDLFTIDTNSVNDGDIYFVADVSDYYEYTDYVPYYLSGYFKLKDKYNPGVFTSWVNIPIEGPIQFGETYVYYTLTSNMGAYTYEGPEYTDPSGSGYVWDETNTVNSVPDNPTYTSPQYIRMLFTFDGVTVEDYRHAKHLDDIIPTILFNNPHCGHDRYDMGSEFNQWMEFPYKYAVENYLFDDEYYRVMASQFRFAYDNKTGDKSAITAVTYTYNQIGVLRDDTERVPKVKTNDKFLKITLMDNGVPVDNTSPDNRMHLEYMRNVVMKYVAQVIPSTAILVLDNFVSTENKAEDFVTILTEIENEGFGVAYGAGTYPKSAMVTLKAVPNEGYHFRKWIWETDRNSYTPPQNMAQHIGLSYDDEISVMACGDKTYTAVFAEDCGVGYGCKVVNCGGPAPQPLD